MGWLATLAVVGLVSGAFAAPGSAAEESAVLRQRAEQLAAEDRCDEALSRARRARELDPSDARAAVVEGRCLLRQGFYREAIAPLEQARELDPLRPGLSTDLAQCHFHLDQLEAATAELDRAEAQDPDDARMHLYRGLVLARQSREGEAAESFDRASALDPGLAPIAGLYAGRSWEGMHERDKAAASFERAREADPDSEWARAAERELEALDAPYHRNVWLRLRGGIEYDDNPALRISGSASDPQLAPTSFGERSDVRGVWEGEAGLELLRDPDQSLGAMVGYDGDAYFKRFHQLDLQYPWISAWYDRRIDEDTWVRLQPFGGYGWLETDPYLVHGGGTVSVSHDFGSTLEGQIFARANVNDFLYRIDPDPNLSSPLVEAVFPGAGEDARRRRDRDGVQYDFGTEWTRLVGPWDTALRVGGSYERYQAQGRDWSRNGVHGWLGIRQPLPFDFELALDGAYTYHDYDHRSSYLPPITFLAGRGPKRRDHIFEGSAELGYPITDWLTLSGRYEYTNDESNTEVFDYDRHIVGGHLTILWID